MTRARILVTESLRFSPEAAQRLRSLGEVRLEDLDRQGLLRAAAWADVLWVRLRHRIDRPVFEAAPDLEVIVTCATGLDHLDLEEAGRRGVRVLSLRGEADFLREIRATAEHTLALALALLRRLPAAARHVLEGGWDRDRFWGHEIHRKTVGVVGLGRLGRTCAASFQALGARVLACDPAPEEVPPGVTLLPLEELLERADLVTLHVGLDDATRGFFGPTQFARMKAGAWLVNTSRGELVDEQALLSCLQNGRLAGAALDVLGNECSSGMGTHPLVDYARSHDNLLITPHLGGATFESVERTERFLAERLGELLQP